MTVFAVISDTPLRADQLGAAIAVAYPETHIKLGPHNWLVAAKATAREVSDKIGISEGENGAGFVFAISSYFGRANPDIWTWIKNNWEATASG